VTAKPPGVSVTENLIRRYGLSKTRRLVRARAANLSAAQVAPEYGVSPQRVCQWWAALGVTRKVYSVHPDVAGLATENRV